jgi:methylenetetrahydrofolate reductase (NADPH)
MSTGTSLTGVQGAPGVVDLIARGRHSWSFEFFPPKTDDGERQLWQAIRELEGLSPTFVSVTYGAGGSTRDRTVRLTERIASDTTLTPVGHLTCVGAARSELRAVIGSYAAAGVRNMLALRGDPHTGVGMPWRSHPGGLSHANELVSLIKSLGDFCVGVAAFPEGHPESTDLDRDALTLVGKADAGADFAVTQFFFDPAPYFALVERVRQHGCTIPIIPGLMPVTNVKQIKRFAELSGTAFPSWLADRLHVVEHDPASVRALGVQLATELGQQLLDDGAPGLHFYTLNRSTATREIYANLDLSHRR